MYKSQAWRDGVKKSGIGVWGTFHPTPSGLLRLVMDLMVMSVRDPVPPPRPFSRSSLKFLGHQFVCVCHLSVLPLTFDSFYCSVSVNEWLAKL